QRAHRRENPRRPRRRLRPPPRHSLGLPHLPRPPRPPPRAQLGHGGPAHRQGRRGLRGQGRDPGLRGRPRRDEGGRLRARGGPETVRQCPRELPRPLLRLRRRARLVRDPEEPGDTLVWKSARVLTRDGKKYGYARLWGIGAETALAVVDILLDRNE